MQRQFTADRPDRVWFTDITQHRASDGWVYRCAVIDAFSRRIVGWSIADHIRSELVVDALEVARWQRRPVAGTIVHADRGTQYTSWVFGHRLRTAGLLGSMGKVASSVDNALIESFCRPCNANSSTATTGVESRPGRGDLRMDRSWHNPRRRHTSIDDRSPAEYETLHATQAA